MSTASGNLIAAERQRRIYEIILQRRSASVSELARSLRVVENTIRRDLDALHRDGKVLRSHGGATIREQSLPALPYHQTRNENMLQKARIAEAACAFLPASGSVFINAGSTTCQLVTRIPRDSGIHVATNSPELAIYLASNTSVTVDLYGGRIVPESLETDGSLAGDILDNLYWDVCFLGISAIDAEHGITSIDLRVAMLERRILQQSRLAIALCDSSKIGRFAHARTGPASTLDVLITDSGISSAALDTLKAEGVEVVIASEAGLVQRISPAGKDQP